MKNKNILDVARKAKELYFPDAAVAFAAGSVFRGEGNAYSDIDLAVLYHDDFQDVRRESFMLDGWPIEAFVHNVQAQNYFFDQDCINGVPMMLSIVMEGIEIPDPCDVSRQQKAEAKRLYDKGPNPLNDEQMRARRYHISDMLDDLRGDRPKHEYAAILAKLYMSLGDFHLRAAGQWSGVSKGLPRALKRYAPDIAEPFCNAFDDAFAGKNVHGVIQLAEEILKPHGGVLFDYKQAADPEGWKNFKGFSF